MSNDKSLLARRDNEIAQLVRDLVTARKERDEARALAEEILARRDATTYLRERDEALAKLADAVRPMSCGHPVASVSFGDEGTNYCRWCEEVARLKSERDEVAALLAARCEHHSLPVEINAIGRHHLCGQVLLRCTLTNAEYEALARLRNR